MSGWGSVFSKGLCDWEVGGLAGRWRVNTHWERKSPFLSGPLGFAKGLSASLCILVKWGGSSLISRGGHWFGELLV